MVLKSDIDNPCSTDYAEEQLNELETLRSIYTEEEFTEVSENPPCFQIRVQSSDEDASGKGTDVCEDIIHNGISILHQ